MRRKEMEREIRTLQAATANLEAQIGWLHEALDIRVPAAPWFADGELHVFVGEGAVHNNIIVAGRTV